MLTFRAVLRSLTSDTSKLDSTTLVDAVKLVERVVVTDEACCLVCRRICYVIAKPLDVTDIVSGHGFLGIAWNHKSLSLSRRAPNNLADDIKRAKNLKVLIPITRYYWYTILNTVVKYHTCFLKHSPPFASEKSPQLISSYACWQESSGLTWFSSFY